MPTVTRGPIGAIQNERPVNTVQLPYWNEETVAEYLEAWAALTKDQRRASRALPPQYVRTPHGIFNRRTAEYVNLPTPMTATESKELAEREAARAKKTRG